MGVVDLSGGGGGGTLGGISAGLGAIGGFAGSIINANAVTNAQNAANSANVQMNSENNATNQAIAQKQMDFQANMSNTAYQRSMSDMKAAGLNPMLVVNNGGASTPGGAGIASQAGHVDPVDNTALGDAIKRGSASALEIAGAVKDFQQKDANIATTKAQGLSAAASAENSFASASATRSGMPQIEAANMSAKSEALARKAKSDFDAKASTYDGVMKRVLEGLGGVTDAFNLRRLIMGTGNDQRNQTMKEESHLRSQGRAGTSLR